MTLVIPPGFASAAFIMTGAVGTQPYVTTLGLDISAYGGNFVNAANQVKAGFATILGPEISNQLTVDRVTLAIGQDGPGGSVDSTSAPNACSRSGTFGPTAQSVIARKVTNDLGRRGRGRMFIPAAATEAEVDADGTIVPARRTTMETALVEFHEFLMEGDAAGEPLPPVLLHSSAPATPTPIIGFAVSDLVGWIRGRIR